jgi:hypothetical protein
LLSGWLSAQELPLPNLDFSLGNLNNWHGDGFMVIKTRVGGATSGYAVSSSDEAVHGHKALLHRLVQVPSGAAVLRFRAYAVRPEHSRDDQNLDVVLLATGKQIIPKQVRTSDEWKPAATLLSADHGQAREYFWPVADYAGQLLRIVLADEDKRPGCYLDCSGFEFQTQAEFEGTELRQLTVRLSSTGKLAPLVRYDTKHFTALSNADENFTETRLRNCELLYGLFYDHFRRKGFALNAPPVKLVAVMFDSQTGFETYLSERMSPLITGLYHIPTNRLVMYDYGQNQSFLAQKEEAERAGRQIRLDLERQHYMEGLHRRAQDFRTRANVGTLMHEVAHQLSFNSGMLNRNGDVPLWLAEGLACYCEATANGAWQGIGELDPERLSALAAAVKDKRPFVPLRDLIESDHWLKTRTVKDKVLLGYGQAWALFRMLMERQPANVRTYMALIYSRRTPDRRLADFQQAFGTDLLGLERRYQQYLQSLVAQYTPPKD